MNNSTPSEDERLCDVAIVGGSAAGLAAALTLARQRRSVIVIDNGEPRNASASHMHGYLGHEAIAPSELTMIGNAEVRSYGAEVIQGHVETITRTPDDQFRLAIGAGHAIVARRVLAATGIVDELPEIDGLASQWGRGVIHCPFCHGYEVRDMRIVHLVTHAMALHPVALYRQLTPHLVVVIDDDVDADHTDLDSLAGSGVTVIRGNVTRVESDANNQVTSVELSDGRVLSADVVSVGPRFRARTEPFVALGLRTTQHLAGIGEYVDTDELGQTSVPGLFAAGNITDPSQQVLHAAAAGSRTGAMIAFHLAQEDVLKAARPRANQADWDHRYGATPLWSGNPNGSLVAEAAQLSPGRALDIGAGEGADALWLAEQGWTVTASDVSQRALATISAQAQHRNLAVELLHADANATHAYPLESFDLVSAQYASIPRSPDQRAVHQILGAVAPAGTLVVVSHDLDAMRAHLESGDHVSTFDPHAYVRVEDFVEVLESRPQWRIEVFDKRPRPLGSASAQRHPEDVVLRARRVT